MERKYKERKRRNEDNLDYHSTNHKKIQIFNLSNQTLNPYELSLLEKGLSFCPNNNPDPFTLFLDLHKFGRKLTLQRFFAQQKKKKEGANTPSITIQSTENGNIHPQMIERIGKATDLKGPSTFYPIHAQGHHLQTFMDRVQEDFRKLDQEKKYSKPSQNLNKYEKIALKTQQK